MELSKPDFSKRAYFYSLFFHGALFLLMLNIPMFFNVEVPKFYELDLGVVTQQRIEQIVEENRRAEALRRLREQGMTPAERIEVPKRKMVEIEEPAIFVPDEQRIESSNIITSSERLPLEVKAPEFKLPATDGSIFSMDRKESFEGSRITVGDEPGMGIETRTIGSDLVDIIIDGEIKGREIISSPRPEYPEGHNKNAVIKISIVVLPDGTVSSSNMIPVRKENAVLEELTMSTLRLWRFSSLSEGDKREQKGIITFIYKVE